MPHSLQKFPITLQRSLLSLQKCPSDVTKVPLDYKSSLPWLQKFPIALQKCPFLWLSLSLSLKVRSAMRFPSIPVYIGVPVVRMDSGRADVRSRDYQNFSDTEVTKFSYPWCSAARAAFHSKNRVF